MINLLPPHEKRQILAARSNTLLIRYCILSLLLAVLMAGLIGGMYLVLINSKNSAEKKIEESTSRTSQYASVKKTAETFTSNLTFIKGVLDKEVHYYDIAIDIAQAVPSGLVIESLSLDAASVNQPLKLSVRGKNRADVIRLKTSFETSKIFTNVYLDSVTYGDGSNDNDGYPVSIIINATIKPEAIR